MNRWLLAALQDRGVDAVESTTSIGASEEIVASGGINTVFIDPLTVGLEEASEFIFRTRARYPYVVFVLYMEVEAAESDRARFYRGSRSRFSHYFTLDKGIPAGAFYVELDAILDGCRQWLRWEAPKREVASLRLETKRLTRDQRGDSFDRVVERIDALLDRLAPDKPGTAPPIIPAVVRKNSVFLSYRFAESEYVSGLKAFLIDKGFDVVTGESATGYISKAIIQRIRDCEYFLCLMTRDNEKADGTFTTSPWLLEEKGVALAYDKYIVLLIEEGVTDYGGLQGDWQRHHFAPKGFLAAALKAVQQLQSASGRSDQLP